MDDEPSVGTLLDFSKTSPQRIRTPLVRGLGVEQSAQVHVKARKHFAAAIDDGGVDPKAGEDAGKLDRDIAAAADQDLLRQLRKMESLIGGNAELVSFERRVRAWTSAGGDQNVAAVTLRPGRSNLMRCSPSRMARVSNSSAPALARLAR